MDLHCQPMFLLGADLVQEGKRSLDAGVGERALPDEKAWELLDWLN